MECHHVVITFTNFTEGEVTPQKDNLIIQITVFLIFSVLGTLSTLGHSGLQLHHWRLVSNCF